MRFINYRIKLYYQIDKLQSKNWKKCLKPNSDLYDNQKAILSGHYVFSKPEFVELKNKVAKKLEPKGIYLDEVLCDAVSKSILRYVSNFRLFK